MEIENESQTQIPKPALKRKQRKTHMDSNAVHESHTAKASSNSRRVKARRQSECMKTSTTSQDVKSCGLEEEAGADDREEVERKIEALQRIVPGGESLGVDKLFEETAGYIMTLQVQLKAMKALASFFEGLEKEKKKFGA
ncbi:transcription factor PAR1 [Argentina anserina]|uniref:transcription factor PAR1 n=1 Tax=Argentina anserina TaxID=57926 RepID=UPI00217650B8|nr:transcription factor PAR1-like [Potentilla anserina]